MKFQILLFIFISICHFSAALFGYTFKYNTHAEPQISTLPRAGTFAPAQKFIEQSLDNFNPQDDRRWQMRYYENNAYFQPGGPIFIYLGGEWTISSGAVTGGTLMVEMAQEMNGMLFYTEHRYYGQSRPTANTTTENLQYLSIDQAMADVAHFIDVIKDSSSDFRNSSVVLVGASYSGEFYNLSMKALEIMAQFCFFLFIYSNNGSMDEEKIPTFNCRSICIIWASQCTSKLLMSYDTSYHKYLIDILDRFL